MDKKLNKIIEITCEEDKHAKAAIVSNIKNYLANNDDYNNGNISINADRFERVDVVIYEGCSNVDELTRVLTM